MKIVPWVFGGLVVLTLAFAIWVRIAPFDEARWHIDPRREPDRARGWYKADAMLPDAADAQQALERVAKVAADWPRTRVLFGDAASGRISFVTRTKLWRFPDVTTVSAERGAEGVVLHFYARQRFGGDDIGVNRARVRAWLQSLSQ